MLLHAHAQVSSATLLQQQCEIFMDQNAKSVIRSQSLLHLPKENFKFLIARDTFVVKEIEIFYAVRKWIEYNEVDKTGAVDLLECVRLTEIPHMELQYCVVPHGLYQQDTALEALRVSKIQDCLTTRGKTGEEEDLIRGVFKQMFLGEWGGGLTAHIV